MTGGLTGGKESDMTKGKTITCLAASSEKGASEEEVDAEEEKCDIARDN